MASSFFVDPFDPFRQLMLGAMVEVMKHNLIYISNPSRQEKELLFPQLE